MSAGERLRCAVVAARGRIILRQGPWSHEIPLADYATWLGFYRGLREREKGRFARFYDQPVAALEAIEGKVKEARG